MIKELIDSIKSIKLLMQEVFDITSFQAQIHQQKSEASFVETNNLPSIKDELYEDFKNFNDALVYDNIVQENGISLSYVVENEVVFKKDYYSSQTYLMSMTNGIMIPGSDFKEIFKNGVGFWGFKQTEDKSVPVSFSLEFNKAYTINKIILKTLTDNKIKLFIKNANLNIWGEYEETNGKEHIWNIDLIEATEIRFESNTNIFSVNFIKAGLVKYVSTGSYRHDFYTFEDIYNIKLKKEEFIDSNTSIKYNIVTEYEDNEKIIPLTENSIKLYEIDITDVENTVSDSDEIIASGTSYEILTNRGIVTTTLTTPVSISSEGAENFSTKHELYYFYDFLDRDINKEYEFTWNDRPLELEFNSVTRPSGDITGYLYEITDDIVRLTIYENTTHYAFLTDSINGVFLDKGSCTLDDFILSGKLNVTKKDENIKSITLVEPLLQSVDFKPKSYITTEIKNSLYKVFYYKNRYIEATTGFDADGKLILPNPAYKIPAGYVKSITYNNITFVQDTDYTLSFVDDQNVTLTQVSDDINDVAITSLEATVVFQLDTYIPYNKCYITTPRTQLVTININHTPCMIRHLHIGNIIDNESNKIWTETGEYTFRCYKGINMLEIYNIDTNNDYFYYEGLNPEIVTEGLEVSYYKGSAKRVITDNTSILNYDEYAIIDNIFYFYDNGDYQLRYGKHNELATKKLTLDIELSSFDNYHTPFVKNYELENFLR